MKRGEKSPLTNKKERGKSMSDYEYKYLKPYKGYDVVKAYELDDDEVLWESLRKKTESL